MKNGAGLCDPSSLSTMMVSGLHGEVPFWTLPGLVIAFVDLFVAYVLLCVSAGVFFPCKFFVFVGTSLPCPCTGLFGYRSSEFCWHKLLTDMPIRNIGYVMELVKSRFPFGAICPRDQHLDLEVSSAGDRRHGASCCGSCGSGSGYEAKCKRSMNLKNKCGIRRRRRAVLGDGKYSSGLNSCGINSVFASDAVCGGISHSLDLHGLSGYGILETRNAESGSSSMGGYLEEARLDEKGKAIELGASSDKFSGNNEEILGSVKNDAEKCRLLEKTLENERVARAALYLELEKERAAAATAADEAMAMILRLQEDKASIEMEAKQYQRMIEEKFAYDEEEMDILKEILLRRERDNHFLERELEAYREVDVSSSEELHEKGFGCKKHNSELNHLLLNKPKPNDDQETATSSSHLKNYERQELSSVLPVSCGLQQSAVNSIKKNSLLDISLSPLGLVETDVFNINGNDAEDNGEQCMLKLKDRHDYSSQADAESPVYDIHVIDEKTIIWKEEDGDKGGNLGRAISDSGICSCEVSRDCHCDRKSMSEAEASGSVRDDLETNSMCSDAGRRLKTDREVKWHTEKLRTMQEEKEKLNFPSEQEG